MFKWIGLQQVGFECPPTPLSVPTSQLAFIEWQSTIRRSLPPPKILEQKATVYEPQITSILKVSKSSVDYWLFVKQEQEEKKEKEKDESKERRRRRDKDDKHRDRDERYSIDSRMYTPPGGRMGSSSGEGDSPSRGWVVL